MLRFNKSYFLLAVLLFFIEVLIAVFLHDKFIRPYFGDFLVVILIYCFCKSFLQAPVLKLAIAVLLFAYMVETLQYFKLVNLLGLQHSKLAQVVIGNSFEWTDMLAYTLGIAVVVAIENYYKKIAMHLQRSPIKCRTLLR